MKKLFIAAAALGLAGLMLPASVSQSQAAIAKSPFCNMAKAQRNPVGWNAYYHCIDTAPKAKVVSAHTRTAHARPLDPYCAMAKAQRNPVGWNAYYHCLRR